MTSAQPRKPIAGCTDETCEAFNSFKRNPEKLKGMGYFVVVRLLATYKKLLCYFKLQTKQGDVSGGSDKIVCERKHASISRC